MAQPEHHHHSTPCEEALAELYTFLDGELTEAKKAAISSHLHGCNPCVEVFDFEAELRIVVSTRAIEQVPESLRLRISETIATLALTEPPEGNSPPAF